MAPQSSENRKEEVEMEVDKLALSTLSSVIQKLTVNNTGSVKLSRSAWLSEEDSTLLPMHDATVDRKEVGRRIDSLQRMSRTLKLLSNLTESLEAVLDDARKISTPAIIHHGINSLPNEILAIILDMASLDTVASRSFITFSSVCRRFRTSLVNSRSSTLWTRIESFRRREWVELQLARSETCPLSVIAHVFKTVQDVQWFWNAITPNSHRLMDLQVTSYRQYLKIHPTSSNGSLACIIPKTLDASRLETLHVYDLHRDVNSQSTEFTSWNMPRLKHLTTDETLFILAPQVPDTLVSLSLCMKQRGIVRSGDILQVIRRFPNVEFLSLDFSCGLLPDAAHSLPLNTVRLDCLRRLDVRLEQPDQTNTTIVQSIMGKMLTPNVQTLSIQFNTRGDANLHHRIEDWLRRQNMHHLRKLEIQVSGFDPGAAVETEFVASLREWLHGKWGTNEALQPVLIVEMRPNEIAQHDATTVLEEGFNWWE